MGKHSHDPKRSSSGLIASKKPELVGASAAPAPRPAAGSGWFAGPAAPVAVPAQPVSSDDPLAGLLEVAEAAASAPKPAPAPVLPPVPLFRTDGRETVATPSVVGPDAEAQQSIRRARRTRRVTRAGVAAIAAGALVAGAIATLLVHETGPAKAHHAVAAAPVRTQRTLLFGLSDNGFDEAALLAADPKARTSSGTLLPSRTITTVPGQGQTSLGRAVALADPTAATASVSDLLGVDVDAYWRITPQALASLVDALGGITVTADVDIVVNGVVVVPAGTQHVSGVNAVALAQYLAPGEDESARLARLQTVLAAVFAALTAPNAHAAAALGALGAGSDSSLAPAKLASFLGDVAAGQASGVTGATFSILPVKTVDTGAADPAYRVDNAGLSSYVSQFLAASVPPGAKAGGVRVFVYSGTLEYGLGPAARAKLVAAGMSFVGSANVTTPTTDASVVLVPDGSDASRAMGLRVAKALGLPTSSVQVNPQPQDVADVVVIAGPDFKF